MSHPPIGTLLDYTYNAAHADHVHVEPPMKMTGTPPLTNPGMTPGVKLIYVALNRQFGQGHYFLDRNGRYVGNDPGVGWTHMGGWNRRHINNDPSRPWSQHAWWNALDIGPYVGKAQDPFISFLRDGTLEDMFTPEEIAFLKEFVAQAKAVETTPAFVGPVVRLARVMRRVDDIFDAEEF